MAQRATDDKQQSRDVTDGIWRHDTPEPTALLRCVVKAKNEQELNSNTEHDELIEKMNGVTNPQARAIIDRTIDYDFEKSNNPRAQSKAVRALVTPKQLEYAWNEYEQKACEYTTWWLFGQSGEDTAPAAFEQLRDQLLKNEGLDDNVGCRVLEQYIDNFDAPLWDFAYYFIETDATETLKRYSDWFMEERGERLATLGFVPGSMLIRLILNRTPTWLIVSLANFKNTPFRYRAPGIGGFLSRFYSTVMRLTIA